MIGIDFEHWLTRRHLLPGFAKNAFEVSAQAVFVRTTRHAGESVRRRVRRTALRAVFQRVLHVRASAGP